jgi:hypothetical protein
MKKSTTEIVEDYPVSWNIDEFKNLKTFGERIKYCEENLTRISSGSARIVYKIDDEKVLKLAKNKKGIAQNEVEIGYSNDYYIKGLVGEIFGYDENNLWLEMQLAQKVTKSIFKRVNDMDFEYFCEVLYYFSTKKRGWFSEPQNADNAWDNDFFVEMINFVNTYKLPVEDFQSLSSYGLVKKNGFEKIVLVDYGLTDKVFDDFYRQK